ncbi:MAG: UDP-glucose 4-epimerase GalE [Flavobacteriales bacterium]|nr:UDP-glucose 4-epimerase GalE [Flavobacteriales bacterium]
MKVLVTGGAGFIGSHTVVELVKNNFTPIIVDDFRNSEKFILERLEKICGKSLKAYSIDCCNYNQMLEVFKQEKPDGIIHFAADKSVNESVNNPLKYYSNNIGSLVNLLKLIEIFPIKSFVFSSSCTVYGDPDSVPVTEKSPIKPAFSPYGYTKQICESCLKDYHKSNSKLSIILLRYFNPIGAHPSGLIGELPIGTPNNLVPYITQTAAGIREKVVVFGDTYNTPDGTCIRDYIHVCDLADSHVLALNYASEKNKRIETFNVGTGKGSSVLEVVNSFEKTNHVSLNFEIGPKREGDAPVVYADNTFIKNELSWSPKYSLDDALSHAWKWQQTL